MGDRLAQLNIETIGDNWRDVVLFTYDGITFKRNTKVRDFLNKLFSASLVAVYTDADCSYDLNRGLSWDSETIIMINDQGVVSYMTNSEWASIDKLK